MGFPGKCREAAAVYAHADGRDPQEVVDNVRKYQEQGYHFIRVQMGGYGGKTMQMAKPEGARNGNYYEPYQPGANESRPMINSRKITLGRQLNYCDQEVHYPP